MKTFLLLVMLIITPVISLFAQKPITVKQDSLQFGNTLLPGISVTIPEVNYENTLKEWTKVIQANTKSKVVTENSDMSIFGALIKVISPNPVNIYSRLMNQDSLLKLVVSFELKKDQYVEPASSEEIFAKATQYIKDFAKDQYMALAKAEAATEEKKLRAIESDLKSLENEKSRLQKSIQSNNSTIVSEKENLVIQNNELTTISAALVEHNNQLNTMLESDAKEEKKDYIKDLEKRQKKVLNDIESSENKINKATEEIKKAQDEIPLNDKSQSLVNEQRLQQEDVLRKFTDKLETIKDY